jgi:hypothetical protein
MWRKQFFGGKYRSEAKKKENGEMILLVTIGSSLGNTGSALIDCAFVKIENIS